jgi:hypothetical protein
MREEILTGIGIKERKRIHEDLITESLHFSRVCSRFSLENENWIRGYVSERI